MDKFFSAIVDAGKGSVDFLAFLAIAIISATGLIGGIGFPSFVGLAAVLCVAWVGLRYALLKAQSAERLQRMREDAKVHAQKRLETYGTSDGAEASSPEKKETET